MPARLTGSISSGRPLALPAEAVTALALIGLLFIGYVAVILVLNPMDLDWALRSAIANVAPIVPLGLAARAIYRDFLRGRPARIQVICHLAAGGLFAFLWYWALVVLLGLFRGQSAAVYLILPFRNEAMSWQVFQGLLVYALVIGFAEFHVPGETALRLTLTSGEGGALRERYLVRKDDEIVPIDMDDIVSISGAQDYCELRCMTGIHLVRTSLGQFETMLPARSFVRIHRSHLVNLDQLVRAEPDGNGKLLLHMADGRTLASSRIGAKRLRERLI